MTRRSALLGLGSFALAASASGSKARPGEDLRFAAIERRLGARVGIAALNTANGMWLTHRPHERFLMCSTFKWILSCLVLKEIERGALTLDQHIPYSAADLLEYAPVTRANVAQGWMTIEDLSAAAVSVSDNTAANLLLTQVGGPAGLTRFIRAHGDDVTRLDRTEPALNQSAPGDPRDTTAPMAMVRAMRNLLLSDALQLDSRARVIAWMEASTRGLDRLRAGLPSNWRAGNKAGTGADGAVNDVAIAWPPNAQPMIIACYMAGGPADTATRSAAHAQIARDIVAHWS